VKWRRSGRVRGGWTAGAPLEANINPRNGRPEFHAGLFSEEALGQSGNAARRFSLRAGHRKLRYELTKNQSHRTRLAARQKEIAMRLALGSSRGRLLRQFVIENFLIAALGGAAGLLGANALLGGVGFLAVPALLPGVGAAVSYLPARRATRIDPMAALREE
jgi:hypothetical protein